MPPISPGGRSQLQDTARRLTPEREHDGPYDRPDTFSARAHWRPAEGQPGDGHGHGSLLLSEGAATFEPAAAVDRRTAVGELGHAGGELSLVRVWLRPPWVSALVLLRDQRHGEIVVTVTVWSHRRLRQALHRTGFPLAERSVWRAPSLAGEAR